MLRNSRYTNLGWKIMDVLTCILMVPFQHIASLTISTYIFTCFDKQLFIYRILRYFILGPLMILLTLLLLPCGTLGYILWMLINALADVQPFIYVGTKQCDLPQSEKKNFFSKITLCSSNICLTPEHIGRINNQRNAYWRLGEIGRRFLRQDPSLNKENLIPPVAREHVILTQLPDVDVFMLQEMFDRFMGYQLYRQLRHKYPYCLYDVGCHTFLGNHGGLGSGLFVASRYPITKAKFHPFTSLTGYAHLVNMGVLIAKLDLGVVMKDGKEQRAVGYIANTHTQAFQGVETIIPKQLQEADNLIEKFIMTSQEKDEVTVFTVIGGDFNSDNMSPGDVATQNLSLWNHYRDPCREHAGEDKPWTVGTEHRQTKMNHPSINDSEAFRNILLDEVQRRHFIIDADVMEHTMDLMYCDPKPDADGKVRATRTGGRRRIDHLISHEKGEVVPTGFWFSTVIGGLTDHIPVVLMLESKPHID